MNGGEDLQRKVETLPEALETRTIIGQGEGFGYLRRRSHTDNVNLRDLAVEIGRDPVPARRDGYPDFPDLDSGL